MIYTSTNNHRIVKALKRKGFVLFDIYYAKPSISSGIYSGWIVDCSITFNTEHYETHKVIDGMYLGRTIKESLKNING
jgi:hypothetical protein